MLRIILLLVWVVVCCTAIPSGDQCLIPSVADLPLSQCYAVVDYPVYIPAGQSFEVLDAAGACNTAMKCMQPDVGSWLTVPSCAVDVAGHTWFSRCALCGEHNGNVVRQCVPAVRGGGRGHGRSDNPPGPAVS